MTDARVAPVHDWRAAVWTAYRGGALTRSARDVLLTLATFRGHGGRIWPSHALLAARAVCCLKTVCRAMEQARRAGLLSWKALRWQTPGGFWRRKSNLYALRLPAATPKGHSVAEGEKPKIKQKEEGSQGRSVAQQLAALGLGQSVADAQAVLTRIAETMRRRQATAYGLSYNGRLCLGPRRRRPL